MFLHKDGITVEVEHPAEIARLKALGYKEPAAVAPVASEETKTPEQQNADAITEANKPIGSRKAKGGEK